jgi:hypothetical protein
MLHGDERQRLLHAMGIDVYVLRAAPLAADTASAAANAGATALVVACARDDARARERLRTLLPHALGMPTDAIVWIEPDAAGALPEPPAATAYLALGADMPRALGAQLSTERQMAALIAAADAPSACLSNSLARRALWQALKPLARRLQNSGNGSARD